VIEACAGNHVVVVASPAIAEHLTHPDVHVIVNDEPERGMAHSLRLANGVVPAEHAIAVVLADKPLLGSNLVTRMFDELGDADVVFPERDGVPGHPVVFSPFARALIIGLPDGDSINLVRDNEILIRRPIPLDDDGAFVDVDTEEDYRDLRA
jgi:molybdenum cofactor cytidylyltransferase